MVTPSAATLIPENPTLQTLREAAASCQACDLWTRGTQTVFGEGVRAARLLLVGEQPGDAEDMAGRPFVGPAGKLLDRALREAGIDRRQAYVTNVVKHFNWSETRGKRRIHKRPNARQISACRPWLDIEVSLVRPKIIVCLGSTAAQALLGRDFRLATRRGEIIASDLAPFMMATVHPSSILRAPDDESRHIQLQAFVADMKKIAPLLSAASAERNSDETVRRGGTKASSISRG